MGIAWHYVVVVLSMAFFVSFCLDFERVYWVLHRFAWDVEDCTHGQDRIA